MSKKKSRTILPVEKRLRAAIHETLLAYETEYTFHHQGGHFIERVMTHLNSHIRADDKWEMLDLTFNDGITWVRTSLYLTLTGCWCKDDRLSIPCGVRQEIEDKVIERFLT